jgi:hypothetical protein
MEMLNQIDPELHREVRRRQVEFWDSCISALVEAVELALGRVRSVEPAISLEEVAADLAYGRD